MGYWVTFKEVISGFLSILSPLSSITFQQDDAQSTAVLTMWQAGFKVQAIIFIISKIYCLGWLSRQWHFFPIWSFFSLIIPLQSANGRKNRWSSVWSLKAYFFYLLEIGWWTFLWKRKGNLPGVGELVLSWSININNTCRFPLPPTSHKTPIRPKGEQFLVPLLNLCIQKFILKIPLVWMK